jgi:hypothetical protein
MGYLHDAVKGKIVFPSFHATDIGGMEFCILCQGFLGNPLRLGFPEGMRSPLGLWL